VQTMRTEAKLIGFHSFHPLVEVPGCDAYREYLYNFLRDQAIWHTLRFWNAALFYALQKDKTPKSTAVARRCSSSAQLKLGGGDGSAGGADDDGPDVALTIRDTTKTSAPARSISESSLSSSSTSGSDTNHTKSSGSSKFKGALRKVNRSKSSIAGGDDNIFEVDERKFKDNKAMAFSHLG